MRFETENAIVEFDDEDTQGYLQDKVLQWFKEHECFTGESVMQNDAPQLAAGELLAEIADEIFQFTVTWKDD